MSNEITGNMYKPNYITFNENETSQFGDLFLSYIEKFIKGVRQDNTIKIAFDFGQKKFFLPCTQVEDLLYQLKKTEGNKEKDIPIPQREIAEFFSYFNLIEKSKKGYYMVEEAVQKTGNASLATLLGHILVEKHQTTR